MIQKVIKMLAVSLSMGLVLGLFIPTHVNAAMIRDYAGDSYLFAVPEGGWSTLTIRAIYSEDYSASGNNNIFNFRQRTRFKRTAYATTMPTSQLLNITHSNGKSFTSYTATDVIYDPNEWEYGIAEYNRDSVTYSKSTGVTGKLAYIVACEGGIPAQYAGSVTLNLKTN